MLWLLWLVPIAVDVLHPRQQLHLNRIYVMEIIYVSISSRSEYGLCPQNVRFILTHRARS